MGSGDNPWAEVFRVGLKNGDDSSQRRRSSSGVANPDNKAEAAAALERVRVLPDIAQDLLDELAGQISAKRQAGRRIDPIPYLDGLIRRARSGTFTLSRGLVVRETAARRKRVEVANRRNETLGRSALGGVRTVEGVRIPRSPAAGAGERFRVERQMLRAVLNPHRLAIVVRSDAAHQA